MVVRTKSDRIKASGTGDEMNFDYTPKVQELRHKLTAFFDEHI
jgi:hypothetical protein